MPETRERAHTAEPWERSGTLIWAPGAKAVVAQASELRATGHVEFRAPNLGSPDLEEIGANAARIVDCVNSLAGVRDPAAALAAARAALKTALWRYEQDPGGSQLGLADAEGLAEALRLLEGR